MAKRREGVYVIIAMKFIPGAISAKNLMVGKDEVDEHGITLIKFDEHKGDVSVHALNGTQGIHTLKLEGQIKGRPVTMLVDPNLDR